MPITFLVNRMNILSRYLGGYDDNFTFFKLQKYLLTNRLKLKDTLPEFQLAYESFGILVSHLEKCLCI